MHWPESLPAGRGGRDSAQGQPEPDREREPSCGTVLSLGAWHVRISARGGAAGGIDARPDGERDHRAPANRPANRIAGNGTGPASGASRESPLNTCAARRSSLIIAPSPRVRVPRGALPHRAQRCGGTRIRVRVTPQPLHGLRPPLHGSATCAPSRRRGRAPRARGLRLEHPRSRPMSRRCCARSWRGRRGGGECRGPRAPRTHDPYPGPPRAATS